MEGPSETTFRFLPLESVRGPVTDGYLIGSGHPVSFPKGNDPLVVLAFRRVSPWELLAALGQEKRINVSQNGDPHTGSGRPANQMNAGTQQSAPGWSQYGCCPLNNPPEFGPKASSGKGQKQCQRGGKAGQEGRQDHSLTDQVTSLQAASLLTSILQSPPKQGQNSLQREASSNRLKTRPVPTYSPISPRPHPYQTPASAYSVGPRAPQHQQMDTSGQPQGNMVRRQYGKGPWQQASAMSSQAFPPGDNYESQRNQQGTDQVDSSSGSMNNGENRSGNQSSYADPISVAVAQAIGFDMPANSGGRQPDSSNQGEADRQRHQDIVTPVGPFGEYHSEYLDKILS